MSPNKGQQTAPPVVQDALSENRQVVEDIRDAADELAVVHAVLTTELAEVSPSENASEAVERTQEVKSKLEDAALKLAATTEVLEQQVGNLFKSDPKTASDAKNA